MKRIPRDQHEDKKRKIIVLFPFSNKNREQIAKIITPTQFAEYAIPAPLGVIISARYSHMIGPMDSSNKMMNMSENTIKHSMYWWV